MKATKTRTALGDFITAREAAKETRENLNLAMQAMLNREPEILGGPGFNYNPFHPTDDLGYVIRFDAKSTTMGVRTVFALQNLGLVKVVDEIHTQKDLWCFKLTMRGLVHTKYYGARWDTAEYEMFAKLYRDIRERMQK